MSGTNSTEGSPFSTKKIRIFSKTAQKQFENDKKKILSQSEDHEQRCCERKM